MMNPSQPEASLSLPTISLAREYEAFLELRGWAKHLWMIAHKPDVADYYHDHGLIATTHHFRMSPHTLAGYVPEVSQDEHFDDAPYYPNGANPGVFFRGGAKHKWLKAHKQDIRAYFKEHGFYATLTRYRLLHTTLLEFLDADPELQGPELRLAGAALGKSKNLKPMLEAIKEVDDKADKGIIIAEAASAGVTQLRREIRELKGQFESFQQSVSQQVGKALVASLLHNMPVPDDIEVKRDTGPLSLREETRDLRRPPKVRR